MHTKYVFGLNWFLCQDFPRDLRRSCMYKVPGFFQGDTLARYSSLCCITVQLYKLLFIRKTYKFRYRCIYMYIYFVFIIYPLNQNHHRNKFDRNIYASMLLSSYIHKQIQIRLETSVLQRKSNFEVFTNTVININIKVCCYILFVCL